MNKLIITRGLPASGKSTKALNWVNEDPEQRVRMNRDELRMAMYGIYWPLTWPQEEAVSGAQGAAATVLLKAGKDVVIDDTNLRLKYARKWADMALRLNVDFEVWDLDTDVDECVIRDSARAARGERAVGEEVIRAMAGKFMWPLEPVTPVDKPKKGEHIPVPWSPTFGLDSAWLFDIDGTLAHNDGHRGWYGAEEHKVINDTTWDEVVKVATAISVAYPDEPLLFMSGRTERCRAETSAWLRNHLGIHADETNLFMRKAGDQRNDSIVKDELFEAHVTGTWNIHGVFDDRPAVTRMWRQKGLRVFHVGDPYKEF